MADDEREVELSVVLAVFEARTGRVEALGALLARYVVVTRTSPDCRNVDLVVSVIEPGRFVVVEKWASAHAQRAHMDAPETVELAEECRDLLSGPPRFDLCEAVSSASPRGPSSALLA